jgi:hypothetical protein
MVATVVQVVQPARSWLAVLAVPAVAVDRQPAAVARVARLVAPARQAAIPRSKLRKAAVLPQIRPRAVLGQLM